MKFILEIKFYFFPILRKITVGGFVNHLIKFSGLRIEEIFWEMYGTAVY